MLSASSCEPLWWAQGRGCDKYSFDFDLFLEFRLGAGCQYWPMPYTAVKAHRQFWAKFHKYPSADFSERKYLSHPSKEGGRIGGRWLLVRSYGDRRGQREKAGARKSGTWYRVRLLSNLLKFNSASDAKLGWLFTGCQTKSWYVCT